MGRDRSRDRAKEVARGRPNPTQRGYGRAHRAARERIAAVIARGEGYCVSKICVKRSRWIPPTAPWHLGHDHDRGGYAGPEHEACNIAEQNRRRARRKRRKASGRSARW